jgi:hypothetical protein
MTQIASRCSIAIDRAVDLRPLTPDLLSVLAAGFLDWFRRSDGGAAKVHNRAWHALSDRKPKPTIYYVCT